MPQYPTYPTFQSYPGYMNNQGFGGFNQPVQPYQGYQGMGQVQNQPQPQTQMTPPTIHADIIQADEEQAREYNIAAGCTQMFMSRDDKYIFIKTAYANGNYDFVKYSKDETPVMPANVPAQNDYVTREEFEKRLAELAYKPKYTKSHQNYKKEDNADG